MSSRFPLTLTFILLVSLLGNGATWGCDNPVDEKRAIVFLDTNGSYSEVIKAQEAACLRGERFIVLPGLETSRKIWPHMKDVTYLEQMVEKYSCDKKKRERFNQRKCDKYGPQLTRAKDRMDRFLKKHGTVNVESFGHLAKQLADDDVAISTIISSGHDGGGSIDGVLGDISKIEVASVMNIAYQEKPHLKKRLTSVLLWGCYTATPDEVLYWKAALPHLKLVAGFSSSGPLNTRESSGGLMKDLLLKMDGLLLEENARQLHRTLRRVEYMLDSLPALLIRSCHNEEYYYHRTEEDDEGKIIGEEFGKFDEFLDCSSTESAYYAALMPYLDGDLPVPYETSKTELRSLYRKVRQLSHCLNRQRKSIITGDSVGLLLFFHEVKKIFADVFSQLSKEAKEELANLDFNEINQLLKQQRQQLLAEQEAAKRDGKSGNGIARQLKRLDKVIGKFARDPKVEKKGWFPTVEGIENLSRRQILDRMKDFRALIEIYGLNWPLVHKRYDKLYSLYSAMESHLNYLNPDCMDFLDWHKYNPKNLPKSECPLE